MKFKSVKNLIGALSVFMVVALHSCKKDEVKIEEPLKNITGTWIIKKATRNSTDLTSSLDFSKFRLKFNADSSYTIENPMPFIVSKNGKYSLDDPQYPFKISFVQTAGSPAAKTTAFNYPTVGGARQIILTFSPGCLSNIYEYTLEKLP